MILRDYQQQAVDSAIEELKKPGVSSTLGVQATGTGKTVQFSHIIKQFLPRGRAMVVADREELLEQARDKINRMCGVMPDLEMSDSKAGDGFFKSPVVCSSIQTQRSISNGNPRWTKFDPNEFSLLVIDEADLAAAKSYREMIDHYKQNPTLKVYGCTATPDRLDEKALGEIFDSVCYVYELNTAIDEGWLVPITQKYLSVEIDLDGVGYSLGDFKGKDLREILAMGNTLEQIASDTIRYAADRRTLVFSDSVENAERMTIEFNRHQIGCARLVTGETPKDERRELIAGYRNGDFQFMVNVGVALRGFDVPEIACVSMARPTASRALYCQAVGRGTRSIGGVVDGLPDDRSRKAAIRASGKPNLLVLDIVGNSHRHKLITCADILGGEYSDDVVAAAEKEMRESDVPCDVAEELEKAQALRNARLLEIAAAAERAKLKRQSKSRDVDPFGILGIHKVEPRGWEPVIPATEAQKVAMEKWGMLKDYPKPSFSDATRLINEFRLRVRRNLATYKQTKVLMRSWDMSPEEARKTSYAEAGRIMTILAANNWKKPKEVSYA